MKKFFLLLALLVAVNVQFSYSLPYKYYKTAKAEKSLNFLPQNYVEKLPEFDANVKSIANNTQSLNYVIADTLSRGTFMTWSNINPMAYDQYNDTYYYAAVKYNLNAQGSIDGTYSRIKSSKNPKNGWNSTIESYLINGEIMGYTSIAAVNPNRSADEPSNFVTYTPSYKPSDKGGYYIDGGYLYMSDGGDNRTQAPLIKPDVNETGIDNIFGITTSIVGYSGGDNSYVAGTNQLFPGDNQQYGLIGQFTMDIPDFTHSSRIPSAWGLDKFFPSTSVDHTYNSFTQIDADKEGNLYAGVYNRFVNAPDNRTPGVSKSTDKGKTWSEFNTMPIEMFGNYWLSLGYEEKSEYSAGGYGFLPYRIDGFVAYGADNYSYFFRLAKFTDDKQDIVVCHLVEANYNGTTWKLRKVADLSFQDFPDQIRNNASGGAYEMLVDNSSLGNEINASKTADGQHILVKWIDIKPGGPFALSTQEILKANQTNSDTGQDEVVTLTVDSLNSTDVFFSYRAVDANTWEKTINVTNDRDLNKGTYLPKMVKDIKNVPFMQTETINRSYTSVNLTTKDPLVTQRVIDLQQYIKTTQVDLTDPALSVEAKNEDNVTFRLNDIYPNPANLGSVQITFSSENTQNGNIQLFDALGNKVTTIYDGIIENTIQGMNFSTSSLNSGVYFVTLTIGTQTITKQFTVVK